jgi:O6-methylguanine-DNA--protein-cysteine methyltransferase
MRTTEWRTEGPYASEAQCSKDLTAVEVVTVFGDHIADTTVEHADLIRAAPEMLKALKTIVVARDHHTRTGKYPEGTVRPGQEFDDWAASVADDAIDVAENGCPVQRAMIDEVKKASFPSTMTYSGLVDRLSASTGDTVFVGVQFMDLVRRGWLRVNDMGVVFNMTVG